MYKINVFGRYILNQKKRCDPKLRIFEPGESQLTRSYFGISLKICQSIDGSQQVALNVDQAAMRRIGSISPKQ